MTPKEFKEVNIRIAEDQPEYVTLPAFYNTEDGTITFAFELNEDEIRQVNETKTMYIKQLTFGKPMQPIALSTLKSDLIKEK